MVGLNTPNRCEIIADNLLKRGYPLRVAEKVLGGNFAWAFNDIWKAEPSGRFFGISTLVTQVCPERRPVVMVNSTSNGPSVA
ncbi:MAG: hypothetical protein JWO52_5911 [Gammaproteobacteria bacterium]|nr:hypothetical protein [Gammaproteobacteria bacterium]